MSTIAHRELLQQLEKEFGPAKDDPLDTLHKHWYSDNGKYRVTCTYSACFLYIMEDPDSEEEGQPVIHITNLGRLPYDFKITKVKNPPKLNK